MVGPVGFEPTNSGLVVEVASAPGSPRKVALWYPVGGFVFLDQVAQRCSVTNLF